MRGKKLIGQEKIGQEESRSYKSHGTSCDRTSCSCPIRLIQSLIVFVLFCVSLIGSVAPAFAQQTTPKAKAAVEVSASVGELYLDVSGWISPYASVVMTFGDLVIRATVADQGGNFSISKILIRKGLTSFCLVAVDFRRLGDSTTCFSFPPAEKDIVMRDIFLPPTLGLYRSEIAAGGDGLAFGYTMPNAVVTLHMSNGQTLVTTADKSGYFEFLIKNVPVGTYKLYATAVYQGRESLAPTRVLSLHALSWWEQLLAFLRDLWKKFVNFVTSVGLGPLWIGIPILILIIILILKLWPERFTSIYESRLVKIFSRRRRRLHHYWFIGY